MIRHFGAYFDYDTRIVNAGKDVEGMDNQCLQSVMKKIVEQRIWNSDSVNSGNEETLVPDQMTVNKFAFTFISFFFFLLFIHFLSFFFPFLFFFHFSSDMMRDMALEVTLTRTLRLMEL